jgi:hypothetical protein
VRLNLSLIVIFLFRINGLEHAQKMGDKPGTLWQMFHDMGAAGFGYVDCFGSLVTSP